MNTRIALSCLSLALLASTAHAAPTLYLGMNGGTMERYPVVEKHQLVVLKTLNFSQDKPIQYTLLR